MKPSELAELMKSKSSSKDDYSKDDEEESEGEDMDVSPEAIDDMKDFMSTEDPAEKYLMFKELVHRCMKD